MDEVFKNDADLFQKIVEKTKILLDILRVSLYIHYLVGHYNKICLIKGICVESGFRFYAVVSGLKSFRKL